MIEEVLALRLEKHDGEIYYKKRGGSVVSFCTYAAILQILKYASIQVRLITSLDERRKILISCYKHPTSGHMGVLCQGLPSGSCGLELPKTRWKW